MFYKLKYWYNDHIRGMVRRLKTIIDYIPVLWQDADWDHTYFLILIQKKLSRMESLIRKGHFVGCEKTADKIKICLNLIKRLLESSYGDYRRKAHTRVYGDLRSRRHKLPNGYFTMEFYYTLCDSDKSRLEAAEASLKIHKYENKMKEQDMDYLFKLLRKYLEKWWD